MSTPPDAASAATPNDAPAIVGPPVELSLPHQVLLIELEDKFGLSNLDWTWSRYLLAGAVVAELQILDRLVATQPNRLAIRADLPPLPGALGEGEAKLVGKERTIEGCITTLMGFWGTGALRLQFIDELIELGALRREADVFIFLPWRWRHPTKDGSVERKVIGALKDHVDHVKGNKPPGRLDLLLSLLRAAGLLDQIWTPSALERKRPTIDERTKRAPIGKAVLTCVRQAQAAAGVP